MTFFAVILLSLGVLVVAGVALAGWLVLAMLRGILGATLSLVGLNRRKRRERREDRCPNDDCGAAWRDGARFCPRCGQSRNPMRVVADDVVLAHRSPARVA